MCGIAGLAATGGTLQNYIKAVETMTEAQVHRGPDDWGVELVSRDENGAAVVLGQRRLAIIDVSPAGHQPMCNLDTGDWITFNGEIYNYQELRRELESLGQIFRTDTDTEVILKAYAQWGTSCVERLRGIFAFAIGGRAPGHLFIARDQLGVKPLYYWHDDAKLLIASEVRALLATGYISRQLNLAGLRSYLAYGSLQEPLTLVQGVHSLLPGHTLIWQNGQVSINRYWQLPDPAEVARPTRPAHEIYQEALAWLSEAVRLQLVADVPLGAFLSGGIDSSSIAALAQKASSRPIKTFSIIFNEASYDERIYARAAARHIGTDHTELCLTEAEVAGSIEQALNAFDQPSFDGLNTYYVSKLVRQAGLTVALSGVGGDELFGGYNRYQKQILAEQWSRRLSWMPLLARKPTARALQQMANNTVVGQTFNPPGRGITGKLRSLEALRKAGALLQSDLPSYFSTRQMFDSLQVSRLLLPELLTQSNGWQPSTFTRLATETAGYDRVNRASALELQTYMLSTLLRDTDQMSMAHALEVRTPLLDHKLVEMIFRLDGSYKLDQRQPKPLLTYALNGSLPSECVHRSKQGFELPFAIWLRSCLQNQMEANFQNRFNGRAFLFEPAELRKIWHQFKSGQLGWGRVWSIFVLCNWLETNRVSI
jgi:asparagine synthase (glutamine-hydrolysing)